MKTSALTLFLTVLTLKMTAQTSEKQFIFVF